MERFLDFRSEDATAHRYHLACPCSRRQVGLIGLNALTTADGRRKDPAARYAARRPPDPAYLALRPLSKQENGGIIP